MPDIRFSRIGFLGSKFHKRHIGWEKGIHLIERFNGFVKSSQCADNK